MDSIQQPERQTELTTGLDHKAAKRRQSAFARRQSSVGGEEIPTHILEASELNAADRRLAEMGYVQVGYAFEPAQVPNC